MWTGRLALTMHPGRSTPEPTDDEIIRSLPDRQGSGLRLLMLHHGASVQEALRKAMGSKLGDSDIDEAMSAAAFHAWRKADSYDPERGTLRAWFYVIARNAARDILREQESRSWQQGRASMDELSAKEPVTLEQNRAEPQNAAEQQVAVGGSGPGSSSSGPSSSGSSSSGSGGPGSAPAGADTGKVGAGTKLVADGKPGRTPAATFARVLRDCIAELPKLQRRIIEADLRSGDVANAHDLAEEYSTTPNSVYVSRSHARKNLRRALQDRGFDLGTEERSSWA
ncbi:MAG: RNA polymerase sigma factor [Planctomycetota bacterium]